MSVHGLREKHIRAMAALEKVLSEKEQMKEELELLRAKKTPTSVHSVVSDEHTQQLQDLTAKNRTLSDDLRLARRKVSELEVSLKALSKDLNTEMTRADEETRLVQSLILNFFWIVELVNAMLGYAGVPSNCNEKLTRTDRKLVTRRMSGVTPMHNSIATGRKWNL